MSDTNSQSEPTMEEILASIRKIISEDGPEAEQEAEAQPGEAQPAAPPQAEADDEGDDEVLDLTQMVNEDGTVVDLAAERDGREGGADAAPEVDEPMMAEPAMAEPDPEPEAAAAPEPEPSFEPEAADSEPEAVADETDADDELALVEDTPAPGPTGSDEGLISDPTKQAATTSLFQLAAAAGLHQPAGGRLTDGRTLEDLVREALTPYLRSWLDQNLPGLVERIVREEIQKMVKRAEYR